MTQGESFDDRLAKMYAGKTEARYVPKMPPEVAPLFYGLMRGKLFGDAIDDAIEVVQDPTMAHRDLISRLDAWAAVYTYATGSQDDRWDISAQMPATDAYHSDVMAPELSQHIKDMLVGYHRMTRLLAPEAARNPELAAILQFEGENGVEVTSSLARVFLALGSRYGIEVVDPLFEEVVTKHTEASERESLGLGPDGRSLGMTLFDDAQLLHPTKPTIQEFAHFFGGVERILQVETATKVMHILGLMSDASPELQKFSLGFYKQHKAMLFHENQGRTFQALGKLLGLIKELPSESSPSGEAQRYAWAALDNYWRLYLVQLQYATDIIRRIESGWYDNPLTPS